MSALTKFQNRQQTGTITVHGTLQQIMVDYPRMTESPSGKSFRLYDAQNNFIQINLSANVQHAITSKQLSKGQMFLLNVAEMQAPDWNEPGLMLVFPRGEWKAVDTSGIAAEITTAVKPSISRKSIFAEASFSL